jgi:AcrR family transcriptional regulator
MTEGQTVSTPARPGPRERLLEAARALTYSEGMNVGVDAILKEADVARRSLYQHFGGKDGLVAEVLHTMPGTKRYTDVMERAGDVPRERILAVFDEMERVTTKPGYLGCHFAKAELSLTDPGHPVHAEVLAFKDGLFELFTEELTRHGHPDPVLGANQLLVLLDGVQVHAVTRPGAHPAVAAKALAALVLDAGAAQA